MYNLQKTIFVLCGIVLVSISAIQAQFQFPEVILDSDGLELDASYQVSFTDEVINTETYKVHRIVDNTGLMGSLGLLHDLSVFNTPLENFYANQGFIIEFTDNTAIVMASLQGNSNEEDKLTAYYRLVNGGNYAETLAASEGVPFGYRNDNSYDVDYENWTYYLIDDSESFLYGADRLAGTQLNVSHSPSNNYFYFQLGLGTVDGEFELGGTGWCALEGTLAINSEDLESQVVMEIDETGGFDHVLIADYGELVLRTYTIIDEQGDVFTEEIYRVNPASCPGDYNQDGFITSLDLSFLLSDFGCLVNCPTDLSSDGAISVDDVSIFLGVFGAECTD